MKQEKGINGGKRKYKGLYYNRTRNAFANFKKNPDILRLVDDLCSLADQSVRYEWQAEVLQREIKSAYDAMGVNLTILFSERARNGTDN